jgi:uncharacterized membrane protein YvlD (DUF360 family)
MIFLKGLLYNALAIFFANYLLPGINMVHQTKLPSIGSDLPFAIILGLLNALIYPFLKLVDSHFSIFRIALACIVLNFVVYALLKVVPLGIHISSIEGYVIPAAVVTIVSFITNFFEMRKAKPHIPSNIDPFPPK